MFYRNTLIKLFKTAFIVCILLAIQAAFRHANHLTEDLLRKLRHELRVASNVYMEQKECTIYLQCVLQCL